MSENNPTPPSSSPSASSASSASSSRLEQLKALAAKSKKPLPHYGLAMEYRSVGDLASAVATFQNLHAMHPDYVPAYFMRAQVHEEMGDIDAARAALETGLPIARRVGDDHAWGEMQSMLDSLPE